jgi:hypothetical protein
MVPTRLDAQALPPEHYRLDPGWLRRDFAHIGLILMPLALDLLFWWGA